MQANLPGNPYMSFRFNCSPGDVTSAVLHLVETRDEYLIMHAPSEAETFKILVKEKEGTNGFGYFLNITTIVELRKLVQVHFEISKVIDEIYTEEEYELAQEEMITFFREVRSLLNQSYRVE
jgi:hypothetical protein